MDGKDKVLLELIGEIHAFCKEHGITYYLAETEKAAYTASLVMDADNLKRFLKEFRCSREDRALEWAGNNHAIIGDWVRYINTSTLHYTQDRLVREINLGMFITIKPVSASKSRLVKLDRYHKHTDFEGSEKRSALLNAVAGSMHSARIAKCKGKVSKKDITEVQISGTPVYVRKSSDFAADPEASWERLIVRKKNSDAFVCDETISYKDLGLEDDRKTLAACERKSDRARIFLKRGEALQSKCVQISNASFCRFCVATDLLMKYSYDDIIRLGAEDGEVKAALDAYIERALKLRKKGRSSYIGDEFTKVINTLYPDIDTDDLYADTPDLYKKGIRVCDYKGELIGIYGGSNGK